ncbi:peptidase A1 domain-containing protein [Favolaschia claudopus]|uniref:Peptidase A1 domain-containing protein n=1 Tax=Favolaschia claudopus TaxID=2862362 RepID=A0AAW0CVV3_9AGAR
MFTSTLFALFFLVSVTLALPTPTSRRFSARKNDDTLGERGTVEGTVGLGDLSDLLYTVPIQLGNTATLVNLDTGSSDLWVVSTDCTENVCAKGRGTSRVPADTLKKSGASVVMRYGDSKTGTYASGPVAADTISVAGVAIDDQLFAAIDETTNPVVEYGVAGILGLGFPAESQIQYAAVKAEFGKEADVEHFVASSFSDGPLISRIAQSGALQNPMFSVALQRSTIDVSGPGALTLGTLPEGVDNSSLTWVPVRLYSPADGGHVAPSFAPNEVYPLRWEIDLEGVFLDGVELAPSAIPATGGVDSARMSALIDTGNSILRGPKDVVSDILKTMSPDFYDPEQPNSALVDCAKFHNLAFKIGGKMFPIDPRDLPTPVAHNNASACVLNRIDSTDAPGVGALFRWNLGDPFFKSNIVAFHFGNLTHPSQDPPRIGFVSRVPDNAAEELEEAVDEAVENGGNFESVPVLSPADADVKPKVTVVPTAASQQAAELTGTLRSTPQATSVLSDKKAKTNGALTRTWNPLLAALAVVALCTATV